MTNGGKSRQTGIFLKWPRYFDKNCGNWTADRLNAFYISCHWTINYYSDINEKLKTHKYKIVDKKSQLKVRLHFPRMGLDVLKMPVSMAVSLAVVRVNVRVRLTIRTQRFSRRWENSGNKRRLFLAINDSNYDSGHASFITIMSHN